MKESVLGEGNIMAEGEQEEETPAQARQPMVRLKLPWGELQARGTDVILTFVLIIVAVTAALVYDFRVAAKAEHLELSQSIKNFTEAVVEQSYILTLSAERRERLGLSMPYSLCKKLGARCGENRE